MGLLCNKNSFMNFLNEFLKQIIRVVIQDYIPDIFQKLLTSFAEISPVIPKEFLVEWSQISQDRFYRAYGMVSTGVINRNLLICTLKKNLYRSVRRDLLKIPTKVFTEEFTQTALKLSSPVSTEWSTKCSKLVGIWVST